MEKSVPPKTSIIMPVYNGGKYLAQAVESILNQTFKEFEFLIINDGSTDGTATILGNYPDPRIKVIDNGKNIGLTKSLNKGLEVSRGEYIARQDADDISDPYRIEKQVHLFEEDRSLGLVGSFFKIMDEHGRTLRTVTVPTEEEAIRQSILNSNPFCHGAAVFRREAIERLGGYREFFKYAQDYDLWLRISEKYRVRNMGEVLYGWRKSEDSISDKKRVEQSQYAMVAITQAMKRKEGKMDDIDRGMTPLWPEVKDLTEGLKQQLLNCHIINMIDSIKMFRIGEALVESKNYLRTKLMLI
jgi:hypothetical protein